MAERLQRLLAGNKGQMVPVAGELQKVVAAAQAQGMTATELEEVAQEVGQIEPFHDTRNTGQATLRLFSKILAERTGMKNYLVRP